MYFLSTLCLDNYCQCSPHPVLRFVLMRNGIRNFHKHCLVHCWVVLLPISLPHSAEEFGLVPRIFSRCFRIQMESIYPNKNEYILLLMLISLWLWCNHCRITCIVWEKGQCKKVDLSVVEIGGHIEREVSRIDYDSGELLYSGVIFTLLIAAFPFLFRLYYNEKLRQCLSHIVLERTIADWNSTSESMTVLFGNNWQVRFSIIGCN